MKRIYIALAILIALGVFVGLCGCNPTESNTSSSSEVSGSDNANFEDLFGSSSEESASSDKTSSASTAETSSATGETSSTVSTTTGNSSSEPQNSTNTSVPSEMQSSVSSTTSTNINVGDDTDDGFGSVIMPH